MPGGRVLLPSCVGQATASVELHGGWVLRGPSWWGGLWSSPGMLLAVALAPATLKDVPLAAGGAWPKNVQRSSCYHQHSWKTG